MDSLADNEIRRPPPPPLRDREKIKTLEKRAQNENLDRLCKCSLRINLSPPLIPAC